MGQAVPPADVPCDHARPQLVEALRALPQEVADHVIAWVTRLRDLGDGTSLDWSDTWPEEGLTDARVIAAFPGARITKARPAVVSSTAAYQLHLPDVILGLITTRLADALCPTDCEITDWKSAGCVRRPAFGSTWSLCFGPKCGS